MHTHDLSKWRHAHVFSTNSASAERGTQAVMWITLAMMAVEIGAGWWSNSMALLADGWHMSSHALALGLSALAYAAARRYASDRRFAFGTWKIEVLAGYTSALLLVCVAALMVVGSIDRLWSPKPILYQEAIPIAVIGLLVNLLCAWILHRAGHTHHDHDGHAHGHSHHAHEGQHPHHHDLNLKSAYLHVVADAATSVLAIVALMGGQMHGWAWLDPVMGLVGAVLIVMWARKLIADTGKVLLDCEMDHDVVAEISEAITADFKEGETQLTDLHVWRVGKDAYAVALALVTHDRTLTPERVKTALAIHEEIAHVTVEINLCS
ncbi:CDF family Co(II)/Ni(II) efflux transporter DmeF [Hylemonella gracilis]|uniref:Cation diffusion facilitator family transporter n=1 Tax=Hylemonella gracilis ATCC 19624 TaxID=887062 RepID=F3KTA2_9BURK|nr:CDF family Co(II)/Ni(II) efflux transporter DmeF [Hylemonella gracilis]EGI77003.1 cation diffusion facilitator family transporter [Hylemonella gracilis ATCC 19624]